MTRHKGTAYGLLLTFDGYGASRELCANTEHLIHVLKALPDQIGMRRLGEPHTVRVDEPGIAGLSGFTFIMESHVSIHTYEERGFVTVDVYSCKDFDTNRAASFIASAFHLASYETSVLVRGTRFNSVDQDASHSGP